MTAGAGAAARRPGAATRAWGWKPMSFCVPATSFGPVSSVTLNSTVVPGCPLNLGA